MKKFCLIIKLKRENCVKIDKIHTLPSLFFMAEDTASFSKPIQLIAVLSLERDLLSTQSVVQTF